VPYPDGREDAHHARIARLAASVNQTTVGWFSIWNEGWQNCANPDPAYAARLSRMIQTVYPWGAHGLSDPQDQEEPAALDSWSRSPANFTLKHGTRSWPACMNRTFNSVYEGHWLLNEDEPTGFGPDVYQPLQHPAQLFGLNTLTLLTGQMLTFFGGHGIKAWQGPGDLAKDWGFTELPELWRQMQLPEDRRGWRLVAGHRAEAAVYPTSFENPGGSGPHLRRRADRRGSLDGDQRRPWLLGSALAAARTSDRLADERARGSRRHRAGRVDSEQRAERAGDRGAFRLGMRRCNACCCSCFWRESLRR
jgi:hypothetical protein